MNGTFKPGDVVRLKSGGPAMTVSTLHKDSTVEAYLCRWFSSDDSPKSQVETFNATSLEHVRK
ncbi:YodC family protein [Aeromonas veronii]